MNLKVNYELTSEELKNKKETIIIPQSRHFLRCNYEEINFPRQGKQSEWFYTRLKDDLSKLVEMVKNGSIDLNYKLDYESKLYTDLVRQLDGYNDYIAGSIEIQTSNLKEFRYMLTLETFIQNDESLLNLLLSTLQQCDSSKSLSDLLRLNTNYPVEDFNKDSRFLRRLNSRIYKLCNVYKDKDDNILGLYDVILSVFRNEKIDAEVKSKIINTICGENQYYATAFLILEIFNSEWFKESNLKNCDYTQSLVYAIGNGNIKLVNYIMHNLNYDPHSRVTIEQSCAGDASVSLSDYIDEFSNLTRKDKNKIKTKILLE